MRKLNFLFSSIAADGFFHSFSFRLISWLKTNGSKKQQINGFGLSRQSADALHKHGTLETKYEIHKTIVIVTVKK